MDNRVTMADIARASGVTKRAVSAVLNPREGDTTKVGQPARERILAAARDLGYRPNRTARNFLQRRHGAIGLLVYSTWAVPAVAFSFLLRRARERDYLLLLEEAPREPGAAPHLVAEDSVDGLIISGETPAGWESEPWWPQAQSLRIPVLYFNTNDRTSPGSVTYAEEAAAAEAVATLAGRGRRRLGVLLPTPEDSTHYSVAARRDGAAAEAARRGMPPPVVKVTPLVRRDEEDVRAFLRAHSDLDALVLYSEMLAPTVYRAAAALGRRIPEDLSVAAFDDTAVAGALTPQLTTFAPDYLELGTSVIDRIVERIASPAEPAGGPWEFPLRAKLRQSH